MPLLANSISFKEQQMLIGQNQPLDIAKRILSTETLKKIARSPYNEQGWKIIDRWAMNSPEKLMKVMAEGEMILLSRLLEQQNIEFRILHLLESLKMKENGLAELEILEMHYVSTEL